MNFLKKHYEKLILAVCLIVFILSLVIQMEVIKNKVIEVEVKIGEEAYEQVLADQNKQSIVKDAMNNLEWKASVRRNTGGTNSFTDFTQPINITFCPKCTAAPNALLHPALIPFDYLGKKTCPYCGVILPKKEIIDIDKIDSDGDGISDKMERRIGLDPRNPNDGNVDTDKDGFSVAFEIKHKADSNDPTSYPPLPLRLYVEKITKPVLGVKLVSSRKIGRNKWSLRVKLKVGNAWAKEKKLGIDDSVGIDGVNYKVVSVKKVTVPGEKGLIPEVTLIDENKKELKLLEGKDVYSQNPVAEIRDVSNKNIKYNVKLNDIITIKMSFPRAGKKGYNKEHKYKVVKIYTPLENKVDVEDLETNKIYTIDEAKFKIESRRSRAGRYPSRKSERIPRTSPSRRR